MSNLTLAVDFGGSCIKSFYTLESFNPRLLLMESEVASVPLHSLEIYEGAMIGNPSPEDSAWIEYKGKYHAVGILARQRFYADMKLEKRKFELAVSKLLALVGAIAGVQDLPNGIGIRLAIVFSWGEYKDSDRFKQIITEALANYKFRGHDKSFVLDAFICLPEGGGILTRGREPGSTLQDKTIAVVMLGHRDVSILLVERGKMTLGRTEALGFSKMIQSVKARTSGLNEHDLAEAICKAGKNVTPKALTTLTESIDPEYKDQEMSIIRQAIADAREEYWALLADRLRRYVPKRVDEVLLSGGTAHFLRNELTSLFSYTQINWCEELERQIVANHSKQVESRSLEYRLTDVYGLFFYLCGNSTKAKVKSNV